MAQKSNPMRAPLLVLRHEPAADRRRNAERWKKAGRHDRDREALWLAASG